MQPALPPVIPPQKDHQKIGAYNSMDTTKPAAGARIDWLSFTTRLPKKPLDYQGFEADIRKALRYRFPMLPSLDAAIAQGVANRRPYTRIMQDGGIAVLFNPSVSQVLIEISGKGCAALGHDALMHLLQSTEHTGGNVLERLTRIDLALDIETGVMPAQIVAEGYSARFEANASINEQSGHTEYVGSAHSDRMCRVYRYNPPHERAHLLRFEYVLRRDAAKAAARAVIQQGIDPVIGSLEHVFAWKHPAATSYDTGRRITAWKPVDKKNANTLRWVVTAVFPALERLEREGALSDDFWATFAEKFPRSQQLENNSTPHSL